ncbi:hypothetical protein X798_05378 [Onchocerca flexuosa]|uniref:Uncharacterized protein n=1 Tax=Onchocerca flexuosa TaxID=387005 RepID=A0A238BQL4_9BILA|nr:hypothetical protein X798_05378 [Onchocerca flexuosa]
MFPGAPASENRKEATLPEPAKKRPRIQETVEVFLPKFRVDLPCHCVHCWMYADYKLTNTNWKNIATLVQ